MHPTSATIRDNETGQVFTWNSRAHRKMRNVWYHDDTALHHRIRLWCCEPHLISWWNVISNMTANIFWVLNGTYGLFPQISENSAQVTYAGAVLGGFFLITTNYLNYVEAINNTSCDLRLPRDDDEIKHKKRIFRRPQKVYGRFKSPIGHDRHLVNRDKFRKHLIEMGFPYIESPESKRLLTANDYDKAVKPTMESSTAQDATTASLSTNHENGKADASSASAEEGKNSSLIGSKVNIVDSNFVTTTQVLNVARNKRTAPKSYQWWTWHPAIEHLGILNAVVGLICALLYMIPMCVSYPWSLRTDISTGKELFFYDLLQGITHTGFTIISYLSVVEAAGSWWKPKLNTIGYYVAILNVVGSIGFALCGYLLIPGTMGNTCCPNAGTASSWTCFLGANAYFVAGILQMIEFANPDPISL